MWPECGLPNVVSYAGHNTLRALLLTDDAQRPSTALEIDRISMLLAQDMGSGALGLSTGLEYDSGFTPIAGRLFPW